MPAWLRRVVLRGLSRDPAIAGRHGGGPRRAGQRPVASQTATGALAGLMVVSAGASAAAMQVAAPEGTCAGLRTRPRRCGATSERRRHGRRSRTGPLGADTWALIEPRLATWKTSGVLRGDRCEAHADGRMSETLHDRSVACLDRQLARVDGLVSAFVVADARVVEQAAAAVAALPALSLCSDADYLMAEVRPPDDPKAQARVADGRALRRARPGGDRHG